MINSYRLVTKIYFRIPILLTLLASGLTVTYPSHGREPESVRYDRIHISGEDPRNGLFDLSVEYADDHTGWLAYSRVENPRYVETHIARSQDRGRTWTYITAANHSAQGSQTVNGKVLRGVWRYETPTLAYDPGDAPGRRWKLYTHRYLTSAPYKKGDRHFVSGGIVEQTAADPTGPWSAGECLFGRREDQCRIHLNSLHSDLNGMVFYSELGSIVQDGVIYLSLDASHNASGLGDWKRRRIVLVSSRDHGRSWQYNATLTDHADAEALGYVTLTGSSLVRENDRLYLLATPAGAKGIFVKNRGHDGTLVIAIEDIRHARLTRDRKGRLVVLKHLKPALHSGGLSDYDEQDTHGGILYSQINLKGKPEFFQIFSTGERIAEEPASSASERR